MTVENAVMNEAVETGAKVVGEIAGKTGGHKVLIVVGSAVGAGILGVGIYKGVKHIKKKKTTANKAKEQESKVDQDKIETESKETAKDEVTTEEKNKK